MEGVSDLGLQRELALLLTGGYRTEARIVAHLAEVERRRLYLKEGFSALFKYCVRGLGLSENEAFHRMTAAHDFPAQVRVARGFYADAEKSRLGRIAIQQFQDTRRDQGVGSVVKGHCDLIAVGGECG